MRITCKQDRLDISLKCDLKGLKPFFHIKAYDFSISNAACNISSMLIIKLEKKKLLNRLITIIQNETVFGI